MSAENVPPGPGAEPVDLGDSLKRDEVEELHRRLGESQEKLAAAGAKTCPSCNADFERGEGRVGVKKKAAKKEKPAEKPAEKEKEVAKDGGEEGGKEEEGGEAEGFAFFE